MKSEICLIRHGITEGNKRQLFYGGVDIPLIDEGREALRTQREQQIYPVYQSAQYFTSGMIRTEQTLEIIYGKQEHSSIELLREYDFGEFEMMNYRDLKKRKDFREFFADKTGEIAAPGGESNNMFRQRIHEGFQQLKVLHYEQVLRLRNRGEMAATVAVIHGGVIGSIMDEIWPGKHNSIFGWTPDPGHGYVLTLEDGGFVDYSEF